MSVRSFPSAAERQTIFEKFEKDINETKNLSSEEKRSAIEDAREVILHPPMCVMPPRNWRALVIQPPPPLRVRVVNACTQVIPNLRAKKDRFVTHMSAHLQPLQPAWQAYKDQLSNTGVFLEQKIRDRRNEPQQRYLTRPVYKACVGWMGPAAAAAVSFLASDLVIHQFLPQVALCLAKQVVDSEAVCDISWYPSITTAWMIAAAPVIYTKFKRGS